MVSYPLILFQKRFERTGLLDEYAIAITLSNVRYLVNLVMLKSVHRLVLDSRSPIGLCSILG